MFTARTATRTAAVLGAATALTVAGAGAAMATTHTSTVEGNDVSVTFELEDGEIVDTCGAVLTPTAAAAGIAAQFAGADGLEDLGGLLETLLNDENVTVLTSDVGLPSVLPSLAIPSRTVVAEDVSPNVYALISYCATDENPSVNPALLVGDPMEAIMGSVEMGSSGGGLDAASSMLGDGGLETASSLLGGAEGGEESPLGSLTGMLGEGALGDTGSAGGESVPE